MQDKLLVQSEFESFVRAIFKDWDREYQSRVSFKVDRLTLEEWSTKLCAVLEPYKLREFLAKEEQRKEEARLELDHYLSDLGD